MRAAYGSPARFNRVAGQYLDNTLPNRQIARGRLQAWSFMSSSQTNLWKKHLYSMKTA